MYESMFKAAIIEARHPAGIMRFFIKD